MPPETRYARAMDGTHVAYQVHGDGPIDILVLRAWHSNLDHEWEEPTLAGVFRRLGSMGRVIRLDRRGTGSSDPIDPERVPTLEHRIDDIRAVLDAAQSTRVVLLGLAHGGALCTFLAATYPERVAGLLLWSPPPSMIGAGTPSAYDAQRDSIARGWGTLASAQQTVQVAAPSRIDDTAFMEWLRQDEQLTGSVEDGVVQWQLVLQTNVVGILSSVHVPTRIVWRGDGWSIAPELAELMPSATTAVLPGDDHMLISGDWHAALREIERFVEEVTDVEPEADRVLATVMFTDLVGSTQRAASMGDRAWRDLVDQHHLAVRRQLALFRGREIDTAGDGFFAAFDGPARAIRSAVAIRGALADLGLDLRIGLHAGECERVGAGLRGVAVHVGARVGASAAENEILVTSTVRDLVAGSGIGFEDAGIRALKGLPESWQLYRVVDA